MVTTVPAVTAFVAIAKVAVVAPAATITEGGTVAAFVLLLVSVTSAPPTGAAAVSVTVLVLFAPPVTVAGLRATDASVATGAAIFRMKPSFPPAGCGCRALDAGKFVDPV